MYVDESKSLASWGLCVKWLDSRNQMYPQLLDWLNLGEQVSNSKAVMTCWRHVFIKSDCVLSGEP